MSTLFATTSLSLYMVRRHPEKTYPKTIEGKYEAFDFDLVLTSPLCFKYFYDFIEKNSSFNIPYLELYVHSKLYQEMIDYMMQADFSSDSFTNDHDQLERLKQTILTIITTHQKTHFNFDNLIKRTLARQS